MSTIINDAKRVAVILEREALQLLIMISQYDRFQPLPEIKAVLDSKVKAFKVALDCVPYNRAEKAVVEWYRRQSTSITVADIIKGAGFGFSGFSNKLIDLRLIEARVENMALSSNLKKIDRG